MGLQGFDLPFLASMSSLRPYLCLKRGGALAATLTFSPCRQLDPAAGSGSGG